MSIKSWKKEFYPVEAKDLGASDWIEATEHSIKKWKGLTEKNLRKHNLNKTAAFIHEVGEVTYESCFPIDSHTCALCIKSEDSSETIDCDKCPLAKYLGKPCDLTDYSPYNVFRRTDDPSEMIEALEGTLTMLRDEQNK